MSRPDVRRRRPGSRLKQLFDRGVDAAAGLVVAAVSSRSGVVGDVGQHDDVERLGDVVEDQQPVVEGEAEIGEVQVVGGRIG